MCSILGMIRLPGCDMGPTEAKHIFGKLLIEGMCRGTDATGFAYKNSKMHEIEGRQCQYIDVEKAPLDAQKFVDAKLDKFFPKFVPEIAIGHCRAHTKGSPSDINNNHPVYDKLGGVCVVHNGHISNDDQLFSKYEMPRYGQVDSETIPKLISHYYWDGEDAGDMDRAVKKASEELSGGFAFISMSAYHPGKVWVVKKGNPCSFCYLPDRGVILIASIDRFFTAALGQRQDILHFFHRYVCDVKRIVTELDGNTIARIDYNTDDREHMFSLESFVPNNTTTWSSNDYDRCRRSYFRDDKVQQTRIPIETPTQTPKIEAGECQYRGKDNWCTARKSKDEQVACYLLNPVWGGKRREGICPKVG